MKFKIKRIFLFIIPAVTRLRRPVMVMGLVCVLGGVVLLHDANATNDAFKNTKHGGGTVDGIPFSGVDRGVNPDYFYYNDASEAGRYAAGECTQCHEPHSSFGGTEPEPSSGSIDDPDGGPDPYLGLAGAEPDFCWYCHENINFNPLYGGGTGFWGFYQGKLRYQDSGHYQNTTMKNPGYGASQPWPRTDRTDNVQYGHCVNCHTPHGLMEDSGSEYDTTAVPASRHTVANNPSVSTDNLIPRKLIAWEEALCENCHQSVGSGGLADAGDIKSQIDKLAGSGSGHPVHNTNQTGSSSGTFSARHSLSDEANPTAGSWNAYSNNSRHVECYDCHNPHVAKQGSSGPNLFRRSGEDFTGRNVDIGPTKVLTDDGYGGANSGVWGVDVNTSTGVISGRKDEAVYLYELCLKCHSAFADSDIKTQQEHSSSTLVAPSWSNKSRWDGDQTYIGGDETMYLTDVAKDFATDSPSGSSPPKGYHPVFALGRNRPSSGLNPRWSTTSYDSRPTGVMNTGIGFKNNFVPPWGPDSYVTCIDCHEDSSETTPRGPHGSDRPFILRKLDGDITYTVLDKGNGSPEVVSYSSFKYGYASSSSYNKTVNLTSEDPNNFCLNCHRADVYGFNGQATGGSSCPDGHKDNEEVWPRYRKLSRQAHPADGENGQGHSFCDPCAHSSTGYPPRGMVCMRCHGGGSVAGIHGNLGNINGYQSVTDKPNNNSAFGYDTSNINPSSNRLLNGLAWKGVRFSTTGTIGGCYKGSDADPFNLNGCTHSGGGDTFGIKAMYNY